VVDEPSFNLRELVGAVAEQLARIGAQQGNGQVRAVPDERAIRYYTMLGLLDRPTLKGRTAFYGVRHLSQVIAIKRLQSAGKSLDEIQQLLPTLDAANLQRISGVVAQRSGRKRARPDFWKVSASSSVLDNAVDAALALPMNLEPAPLAAATKLELVCRMELAPGVTLSFPLAGPLEPEFAARLESAAKPLLELLAARSSDFKATQATHSSGVSGSPNQSDE
jgi:DNA-binding transcriptional MerR regulator